MTYFLVHVAMLLIGIGIMVAIAAYGPAVVGWLADRSRKKRK